MKADGNATPQFLCEDELSYLVVDGMTVLQELKVVKTLRIAKTLTSHMSSSLTRKLEAMITRLKCHHQGRDKAATQRRYKENPIVVDKEPHTPGAWLEQILRAHLQANILVSGPYHTQPLTQ